MFGDDEKVRALIGQNAILKRDYEKMKAEYDSVKSKSEEMERLTRKQEDELKELRFQTKHMEEKLALEHSKKTVELRQEMQKALVNSDLTRVEALAKLAVYEKTDTKADANVIKEMLGKLIDQVGKVQPATVNVVK